MNERFEFLEAQLKQAGERVARAKALWLVNSDSDHANQLYERYRAEQAYLAQLLDALFQSKNAQAS
ncbi:hypothetical protein IW967_11525 [Alicyclobacillus mali]|uniref:Uncharacterized protein n=1 Tax=Alicyclobacillus mali (ex Roth et al. 2021) TaxID=1123961 RepID=A0ABS0F5A5_9BACL|nr:hypothetical protein [Alicyclobacillus mali (ex Roth et al. 2021)]MBF8378484.1 hypothetical protein [Alicyclobacillus mali (ex Roth et al. 2021)]